MNDQTSWLRKLVEGLGGQKQARVRRTAHIGLDALEGRQLLSRMVPAVSAEIERADDRGRHNRAEVETGRRGRGTDDAPNHDALDDKGGQQAENLHTAGAVDDRGRRHGGRGADDPATSAEKRQGRGRGADDAIQGASDDRGRRRGGRGADDPANHDLNDDRGGRTGGNDDPANHDVNDDRGGRRNRRGRR